MDAVLKLDDDRILRGEVTREERGKLEQTLLTMLFSRAKTNHIPVSLVHDVRFYNALKKSEALFSKDHFYIFVDKKDHVRDMTPVAYHLLDTDEGLFYAKLMQFDGYRPI